MGLNERNITVRGFWKGISIDLLLRGNIVGNCKISPNGKFIVYTIGTEHGFNLFLTNLLTKEAFQLTEGYSPASGTPYGGGVVTWTSDSTSIIFSTGKGLFKINITGGLPKLLIKQEKAFSPFSLDESLLYSVEEEDQMSLMYINHEDKQKNWPHRLPILRNFLYDAVMHPINGSIAVHSWNFPNMSWNGSKIELLIPEGNNFNIKTIAGSETIATAQPKFSPDGKYLTYLNEESGWRNLWIANANGSDPRVLVKKEEEHAYVTWVTGNSNHVWLSDSKTIVFTRNIKGVINLAQVNIESGEVKDLDYLSRGTYENLSSTLEGGNMIVCQYSNHSTKPIILVIDLDRQEILHSIRSGLKISDDILKQFVKPEILTFPTKDGQQSHGLFYLIKRDNDLEIKIPCIFLIHGGPTGMQLDTFNFVTQYFASRGWAVFSINHRGSIGYGKEYREILNGNWGYYDVEDTLDAYKFIIQERKVDPEKCAIMGGSAGGYSTLMFLIRHPGVMKAGINLFGISELFMAGEDTHYLESQYNHHLIGSLPEDAKKYYSQSPVYHADKIQDPLLILHGEIDKVVPKNQSELIKQKVEKNNGIVEMKIYKDEGHGFVKFESNKDWLIRAEKFLKMHVLYDRG